MTYRGEEMPGRILRLPFGGLSTSTLGIPPRVKDHRKGSKF